MPITLVRDTCSYLVLLLLFRVRPQFLGLQSEISLNCTPGLTYEWFSISRIDQTLDFSSLLLDSDSRLTPWFGTAIVLRKRKWISRSIHIDSLLVVCWNVNSPQCATHWDRTLLFIMDKIALFRFNNLLVVKPVMGLLKHSRMPATVICISMSSHLCRWCHTVLHFPDLGAVLRSWNVKCTHLSLSHRHAYTKDGQQLLRRVHGLSCIFAEIVRGRNRSATPISYGHICAYFFYRSMPGIITLGLQIWLC